MDKSKTCYLFFDLDGTVYINKEIPKENRKAMKAVQKLGHKLILHTGRSYASVQGIKEALDFSWDGMILGASDLRFEGKVLEQQRISKQDCFAWLAYALRHHATIVYGGADILMGFSLSKHPEPFTEAEIEQYKQELDQNYEVHSISKLTVYGVLDQADLPETALTVVQLATYVDIFPAGCDKGPAIQRFCELLDVPLEQCACFGDSENDLAMFRVCSTSVCMKNAPTELVTLATHHAETDLGVAEGLHKLFYM